MVDSLVLREAYKWCCLVGHLARSSPQCSIPACTWPKPLWRCRRDSRFGYPRSRLDVWCGRFRDGTTAIIGATFPQRAAFLFGMGISRIRSARRRITARRELALLVAVHMCSTAQTSTLMRAIGPHLYQKGGGPMLDIEFNESVGHPCPRPEVTDDMSQRHLCLLCRIC